MPKNGVLNANLGILNAKFYSWNLPQVVMRSYTMTKLSTAWATADLGADVTQKPEVVFAYKERPSTKKPDPAVSLFFLLFMPHSDSQPILRGRFLKNVSLSESHRDCSLKKDNFAVRRLPTLC